MAIPQAIKEKIPSRFTIDAGLPQSSGSQLLTSFEPPKVAAKSSPTTGSSTSPIALAKTVVQGMFRQGASIGLTLANKPELPVDPSAPEAEKRVRSIMFGDEKEDPVKSLATRIAEGEMKAKELGFGKASLPVSAAVIGGLTIADFLPGGKPSKEAIEIAVSKNIDEITKIAKRLGVADEVLPKVAKELVEETDPKKVAKILADAPKGNIPSPTVTKGSKIPTEPKLKTKISDSIADEAINVAKNDPESGLLGKEFRDPKTKARMGGPRLFQRIGDALESGEIDINSLPDLVKGYGLSGEEAAKLFKGAASYSGRTLNALSRVEKELRALIPDIPIEKAELTPWQIFKAKWNAIDNFRRGLLVSQVATATRNVWSQGARYTLEAMNDGISGVINKVTGKPEPFAALIEDVAAIFRRLDKGNLDKIAQVLKENPLESSRLLNTPVGDVALGQKITNVLNAPNRLQEYMYRNLILDAKLHTFARQRGVDITKLNSDEIARAVDQALELTFSASPKAGSFLADVLKTYRTMPFSTVLVNPFPRFHMNSLKFIVNHSPLGLMSLFSSKTRAAIAAGDPKAISRATTGIMMLSAATVVRNNNNIGGEKWYELKVKGKTVDLRPFAPFSTYLFIAELWSNPERLTGQDFAQAALSINRIAGSGLAIVDLFDRGTPEGTAKFLKEFTGQYLGGWTVPFRSIADVVGHFKPEASVARDTKENPILGPAIANLPFLNETLPELPSLFEEKPIQREKPLLRQVTGITVKTKPYILKEIDRLGLQTKDFIPKTGDPTINRIITKATGKILDQFNDLIENSSSYQNSNDEQKTQFIKDLVSEAKKEAKGTVAKDIAEIVYEELRDVNSKDVPKLMKQLTNKGLLTENILDFLLPMIEANPL